MRRALIVPVLFFLAAAPTRAGAPTVSIPSHTDGPAAIRPFRTPIAIEGAVVPPERIRSAEPEYPEAARRAGITGKVVLRIVIDEQGDVASLEVLESNPMLDEAAIDAVREWKYRPATLDGKPVVVFLTVVVDFQLPPPDADEGEAGADP